MCIAFFLFDLHPKLLFLLAFNRDEFWSRPTQPAHFWVDAPHVLGGRDVAADEHGTWLGVTTGGRVALLTNFRERPQPRATPARSRGALTTGFLRGDALPLDYLSKVAADGAEYVGFNLVVADLATRQAAYYSNRDHGSGGGDGDHTAAPRALAPGAYGLSNGLLQQWPKVEAGLAALDEVIDEDDDGVEQLPWDALFSERVLRNATRVPLDDARLPLTGVGAAGDHLLSAIFVEPFDFGRVFGVPQRAGERYGTRSQTVLGVWRDGGGRAELRERYVDGDDEWREVVHRFEMAGVGGESGGESDGAPHTKLHEEL